MHLGFSLRSLAAGAAFAIVLSTSGAAAADDTNAAPARPADAVQRTRIVAYVAMSAGAAAIATGVGLYAYGATHVPDGCTLQSCDVRTADGAPSSAGLGAPCARDVRQDGCIGSAYNVSRQAETARADVLKTTGAITAVAGAVVLAGGLVLWLRTPRREKAAPDKSSFASAQLVPIVSVGFGGVGVVADF